MDSNSKTNVKNHPPQRRISPATPNGNQIDAKFVLAALRRWMLLAIPVGLLLGAGGGIAMYLRYEPEYRATAALLVQNEKPYIAFEDEEDNAPSLTGEMEILRSPMVIDPLLADETIAKLPEIRKLEDPARELPRLILVGTRKGSELMRISFVGPNAKNTKTIVNAVVNQYLAQRARRLEESTNNVISRLEKEMSDRQQIVKDRTESVSEQSKILYGRDPFLQDDGKIGSEHPMTDLQARITQNQYTRKVLLAEIESLEEKLEEEPPVPTEEEVTNRLMKDESIVRKRQEIWNAEEILNQFQLNSKYGSNHPEVKKLKARIRAKNDTMAKLLKEIRPEVVKDLTTQLVSRKKAEVQSLKNQLKSLEFGGKFLEEQMGEQKVEQGITLDKFMDLQKQKGELKKYENALEQIGARVFALRTEQFAPPRVERFYAASTPLAPENGIPFKQIALIGFAGFCLPFGLALLWEVKVRRFSDSGQLAGQFDTPIVAEVANLPRQANGKRSYSRRLVRDLRIYEESVDSLRTNLLLAVKGNDLKVLAVASSVSGEGKTSLATRLAVSLSKAVGKKTLLIDGDMRAPDIHYLFDIEPKPGLADVLAGNCELDDAIVETTIENLDVLPAGQLSNDPAFLLSNGSAKSFFDQVRDEYAFAILDTPPILSANESMLLTDAADGTLFCVMRDTSRHAQVNAAWQRLKSAGGKTVGVVFNNVPSKNYAKTYGNYDYQLDG